MPLYLFTCPTCELEAEELFPLGQVPEKLMRCPLCGGWFVRDLAIFHVGGRKQVASVRDDIMATPATRHPLDCLCCRPRR